MKIFIIGMGIIIGIYCIFAIGNSDMDTIYCEKGMEQCSLNK